ncbi:MAG: nitroreductase family protein, partial [Peptococcaceae bacterium]|nr:nitroreductase family protein [Peptococcaceae bacterium]
MLDLLLHRRSIRKFTSEPVAEADLQKILQAGLLSPSGRNKTPWEFVVVQDKASLQALGKCRHPEQPFLPDTPLAIVVLGDTSATDVWIEDCAIAMTIMQLEAEILGLGSCWVQVRNRMAQGENQTADAYIKTLLSVPDYYEVLAVL